ncbi:ABC transporter ATP-binding protein [Litoribacter alkaliphilus]|uniref:ABC transporter ATP-binding protein n=1 Tax=Litoribacter ruber TaxID=702568 RepID=A0AAP2CGL3_9BACT|nr:ABC transporter ATP-binding protein [Litoribacter alkaliphilus]MBS9523184.1 ABC transporter ATP-binding protein [Litoribacter alkaliphilus]
MSSLKKLFYKYFSSFAYFYQHLRYRIFIALALSLSVGLMDGLGIAMFLPLLESTDGQASAEGLGNLGFLLDWMDGIGLGTGVGAVLIVLVFFFSMKGLFYFCSEYYSVIIRRYYITKMRFENIDSLADFNYKSFVLADSGRIQNTFSGEVGQVLQSYIYYFHTIQAVIMVSVYATLAFFANPHFALLVVLGGVATNFLYGKIYKKTKELSAKITEDAHEFQGLLVQKVAFFKYLKATGLVYAFGKKLKETIVKIEDSSMKIGKYGAILSGAREPLVVSIVAIVILIQLNWFGTNMGVILLSLLFFYRALAYLMGLQNTYNAFIGTTGSLNNMTAFMKELREGKESFGDISSHSLENSIVLKDLNFHYGITPILTDINLTIRKNETVAFVGESGSGKTTLVNIIAGLMAPDSGNILVDGIDRAQIDIRSFALNVGYITQEPVIFDDTIFNNITFWAEDNRENKQKFWKALEKASIAGFVRSLPEKEYSHLGSNGIMVSGGQKQRLSIARELYKDIEILIMDEATSALDSETEKAIQQNIEALKGKYTILIVAHRLSTVKNADRVVLLQKGKIMGTGEFYELVNDSVTFKNMVALQEI